MRDSLFDQSSVLESPSDVGTVGGAGGVAYPKWLGEGDGPMSSSQELFGSPDLVDEVESGEKLAVDSEDGGVMSHGQSSRPDFKEDYQPAERDVSSLVSQTVTRSSQQVPASPQQPMLSFIPATPPVQTPQRTLSIKETPTSPHRRNRAETAAAENLSYDQPRLGSRKPHQVDKHGDIMDLLFMSSSQLEQLDNHVGSAALAVEESAGCTPHTKVSTGQADKQACSPLDSISSSQCIVQPPPSVLPVSSVEVPSMDGGRNSSTDTKWDILDRNETKNPADSAPGAKRKKLTTKTFLYPGSKQLVGGKSKGKGKGRRRGNKRPASLSLLEGSQLSKVKAQHSPRVEVEGACTVGPPAKRSRTEATSLVSIKETARGQEDTEVTLAQRGRNDSPSTVSLSEKPLSTLSASEEMLCPSVGGGNPAVDLGTSEPMLTDTPADGMVIGTTTELCNLPAQRSMTSAGRMREAVGTVPDVIIEPVATGCEEAIIESHPSAAGKTKENVHDPRLESSSPPGANPPGQYSTGRPMVKKARASGLRKTGRKSLVMSSRVDSPNPSTVSSLPTEHEVCKLSTTEPPQQQTSPAEMSDTDCFDGSLVPSQKTVDDLCSDNVCRDSSPVSELCPMHSNRLPSSTFPEHPPPVTPASYFPGGFQTASGQAISISDQALEAARCLIAEEMDGGKSGDNTVGSVSHPATSTATGQVSSQTDNRSACGEGIDASTPLKATISLSTVNPSSYACETPSLVCKTKPQTTPLTATSAFRTPSLQAPTSSFPLTVPRRAASVKRRPARNFKAPRKAGDVSVAEERASVARILRKFGSTGAKSGGETSGAEVVRDGNLPTRSVNNAVVESGFLTAGGRKLSVSASAMQQAQRLLSEDKENGILESDLPHVAPPHQPTLPPPPTHCPGTTPTSSSHCIGFQTASGKGCSISAASMERARKLVGDIDREVDGEDKGKGPSDWAEPPQNGILVGFQTASGKSLTVHSSSMTKAVSLVASAAADDKEVEGKEEGTLSSIGKEITPADVMLTGFLTAGGKGISVAAKSLNRAVLAQEVAEAELEGVNQGSSQHETCTSSIGFQSTERRIETRPERSLRGIAVDRDFASASEVGRRSGKVQVEQLCAAVQGITTGFQTAGGRKIAVSADALHRARCLVESNEENEQSAACVSNSSTERDNQRDTVPESIGRSSEIESVDNPDELELGELDIDNLSTFTQIDFKSFRSEEQAEEELERGADERSAENQLLQENRDGASIAAEKQLDSPAVHTGSEAPVEIAPQTHDIFAVTHQHAAATQRDTEVVKPFHSTPHQFQSQSNASAVAPPSPLTEAARMDVDGLEDGGLYSTEADQSCFFSTQVVQQILDFSSDEEEQPEEDDVADKKSLKETQEEAEETLCDERKGSSKDLKADASTPVEATEKTVTQSVGDENSSTLMKADNGDRRTSNQGVGDQHPNEEVGGAYPRPPPLPPLVRGNRWSEGGSLLSETLQDESSMIDEIFGIASMEVDEQAETGQGVPEKGNGMHAMGGVEGSRTEWKEQTVLSGVLPVPVCSSPEQRTMDREELKSSNAPESDDLAFGWESMHETPSHCSATPLPSTTVRRQATPNAARMGDRVSPRLNNDSLETKHNTSFQEHPPVSSTENSCRAILPSTEALGESVVGFMDQGTSHGGHQGMSVSGEKKKETSSIPGPRTANNKAIHVTLQAVSPAVQPAEFSTVLSTHSPLSSVVACSVSESRSLSQLSLNQPMASQQSSQSSVTRIDSLQMETEKALNVSAEAPPTARRRLEGSGPREQVTTVTLGGLQTASGRAVQICQKSLDYVRSTLGDGSEGPAVCADEVPFTDSHGLGFTGLKTASGLEVRISACSLQAARQALGKTVVGSHDAPTSSQGPLVPWDRGASPHLSFPGLTTDSEGGAGATSDALAGMAAVGDRSDPRQTEPGEGVSRGMRETSNFPGLMTASGKKVDVSEKALTMAKSTLGGHETLQRELGTALTKEQVARTYTHRSGTVQAPPTFMTAAGRQVEVSQRALTASRLVLDSDTEDKRKAKDTNQQRVGNQLGTLSFPGLMTAAGEKVEVAQSSLLAVRKALSSEQEGEEVRGRREDQFSSERLSGPPSVTGSFPGLMTAGGGKVEISDGALQAARQTLGVGEPKTSKATTPVNPVTPTLKPSVATQLSSTTEKAQSRATPVSSSLHPHPDRCVPASCSTEPYKPIFTVQSMSGSLPVSVAAHSIAPSPSSSGLGVVRGREGGGSEGRYRPVFKGSGGGGGTQARPVSRGATTRSPKSRSHRDTVDTR